MKRAFLFLLLVSFTVAKGKPAHERSVSELLQMMQVGEITVPMVYAYEQHTQHRKSPFFVRNKNESNHG